MSKGFNWEIAYDENRLGELEALRKERLTQIEGDPMKDLEYVQIRLSQEVTKSSLLAGQIQKKAYDLRDRNHKTLGKQYGIASREIARLKGELALQQQKYNTLLVSRGQWFD